MRDRLIEEGLTVEVAASQRGPLLPDGGNAARGVEPDHLLSEAQPSRYDAVYFVGTPGPNEFAAEVEHRETARRFIQEMLRSDRYVTSLCRGTVVLLQTRTLDGRTAARSESVINRDIPSGSQIKWRFGEPFVQDGRLFTGRDPEDARAFAARLAELINALPRGR